MIPYKFKGATYTLCRQDSGDNRAQNGSYSTWASKVNIGNGILQACVPLF